MLLELLDDLVELGAGPGVLALEHDERGGGGLAGCCLLRWGRFATVAACVAGAVAVAAAAFFAGALVTGAFFAGAFFAGAALLAGASSWPEPSWQAAFVAGPPSSPARPSSREPWRRLRGRSGLLRRRAFFAGAAFFAGGLLGGSRLLGRRGLLRRRCLLRAERPSWRGRPSWPEPGRSSQPSSRSFFAAAAGRRALSLAGLGGTRTRGRSPASRLRQQCQPGTCAWCQPSPRASSRASGVAGNHTVARRLSAATERTQHRLAETRERPPSWAIVSLSTGRVARAQPSSSPRTERRRLGALTAVHGSLALAPVGQRLQLLGEVGLQARAVLALELASVSTSLLSLSRSFSRSPNICWRRSAVSESSICDAGGRPPPCGRPWTSTHPRGARPWCGRRRRCGRPRSWRPRRARRRCGSRSPAGGRRRWRRRRWSRRARSAREQPRARLRRLGLRLGLGLRLRLRRRVRRTTRRGRGPPPD